MKIFVALTLLVIATVTAKVLRIDSKPGLGFPGSGMAYDCFLGIGWIFILCYTTSCYQVQTETEFIRLTVSLRSYLKVFTRIHKKNSQKKIFFGGGKIFLYPSNFQFTK